MMELQRAYDELKSHSERKISDLCVQISSTDPSAQIGKSKAWLLPHHPVRHEMKASPLSNGMMR